MNTKNSTKSKDYADYYLKKFNIWYRKVLPVDVPFSFIAKRACCGKILDIGCGPGRYLKFFKNAVGVDHNKIFIEYAKKNGFEAYLINEFKHKFDSLLFDTVDRPILSRSLNINLIPYSLTLFYSHTF